MPGTIAVTVSNVGSDDLFEDAVVKLSGVTNKGKEITLDDQFVDVLPAGGSELLEFTYIAPSDVKDRTVVWTATVVALSDANVSNNEATDRSNIKK